MQTGFKLSVFEVPVHWLARKEVLASAMALALSHQVTDGCSSVAIG
jgi:hypothetical protein